MPIRPANQQANAPHDAPQSPQQPVNQQPQTGGIAPTGSLHPGGGISTQQTQGGGIAPQQPRGRAPAGGQPPKNDLSWTHTGQDAAQISQQENQRAQQRKAEAKERGFWPIRFYIKHNDPNPMARIILLDQQPGPRYWEHELTNPKTGFSDVYEPCPKEFETCPICSGGQNLSYFVMLLTALDLRGYQKKDGTFIPVARNLVAVKTSQHGYFDRLAADHGGLRGVELRMVRDGSKSAKIGNPEFVAKHSDQDIVAFLSQYNMMGNRVDKDGNQVEPPGYMAQPFNYSKFLHRPSAERLRRLYGGQAPVGSSGYNGGGNEWGNESYNPGSGAFDPNASGGMGGDLDDEIPFD